MDNIVLDPFFLIGITVRTTNENGQSSIDIPKLWETFFARGIRAQIPEKISEDLYCVYTDYEQDHTKPYTTLLGCRVQHLDHIPEGMHGLEVKGATYRKFTAKGKITEGIVFQKWLDIWNTEMSRDFTTDFEIYGPKAQNPDDAEIDIFVSVR
jgi:predicted transcriptional regulator YdeE